MFTMKPLSFFVFLMFFSLISQATDWSQVPWKSGQVIGISSRAGLTPMVVHLGTLSQVDHIGVVSMEQDGPWIYEFTNATGIQKVKVSEFWARSADIHQSVHYVLGEFSNPLTAEEWSAVTRRLDSWVLRSDPNPPTNCIETLLGAFKGIRKFFVRTTSAMPFADSIGPLPLLRVIQQTYKTLARVPVISSVFEGLQRKDGNIQDPLMWANEETVAKEWSAAGDASKFARSLSAEKSKALNPAEINSKLAAFADKVHAKRISIPAYPACEAMF
jgi:hypothetical protein